MTDPRRAMTAPEIFAKLRDEQPTPAGDDELREAECVVRRFAETFGGPLARYTAEYDERGRELERLRALMTPPVDPMQVVALGQARELIRALDARVDALEHTQAQMDADATAADEHYGAARDGVLREIVAAGLHTYVCEDDDLPDIVRHALAAARADVVRWQAIEERAREVECGTAGPFSAPVAARYILTGERPQGVRW